MVSSFTSFLMRSIDRISRDGQLEIADLKARVVALERMVEKLANPPPAVPREAVFRPSSPLPDIGFPDEIPGLTVNQAIVDQYLDWQSYDKTWPHGGDEADDELDGMGNSDKENEWVVAASSQ